MVLEECVGHAVKRVACPPDRIQVPHADCRVLNAKSSRNIYLSDDERELALTLSAALTAGAFVADKGAEAVVAAAREILDDAPIAVDYLELRGSDLGEPKEGDSRLLVAARVGTTRLIDNVGVPLGLGFKGLDQE